RYRYRTTLADLGYYISTLINELLPILNAPKHGK
ncbi:unnamed protein product, partial [Rotaria socialis]